MTSPKRNCSSPDNQFSGCYRERQPSRVTLPKWVCSAWSSGEVFETGLPLHNAPSPTNNLANGIAHTIISFAVIALGITAFGIWLPEIEGLLR